MAKSQLYSSGDQCRSTSKQETLSHDKIIFIIAYYRSGSSFTGSIFQQIEGTFYLFEPIKKVYQMLQKGMNENASILTYVNGMTRTIDHLNGWQVIYEEIDNWLSCNIKAISIESILDNRQLLNSYTECTFTSFKNLTAKRIMNCINKISQTCKTLPVKVIKFIRLRMKYALLSLHKYPNLKLLHLVRDPRGIFNSRFAVGPMKRFFSFNAHKHCTEVAEDVVNSLKIFQKCPNTVRIVLFEKIAEIPEKTTRRILNFTGFNISKQIIEYLRNQTNADSDSGQFGLKRESGLLTVNKWRYSLDIYTARELYNICWESNVYLGYLPLSRLMRNNYLPSRNSSNHSNGIMI